MNIREQIADETSRLDPEDLQYVCKLVALVRYCPGFSDKLKQIVPASQAVASSEQLSATAALMNKWLYEKGQAEILRAELERVGVRV